MDKAFEAAERAGRKGEVPVGAVVVSADHEILAVAGNQTETLRDPTAHAEIVALREAAAIRGNPRLTDCDLYVTLEPCAMCAGAIAQARIRRVYFAAEDKKGGACENGVRLPYHPTCLHRVEIYGGFSEERAAKLLRDFFSRKR